MAAERVHTFLILKESGKPDRILVWDTQDLSVGRAPENDLTLDSAEISRRHALFTRLDDAFVVKDLGTSNGTIVNGQPVQQHQLQNEDVVSLGDLEVTYYRLARNPAKIGKKVEYVSQLKSFNPPGGAAAASANPEATMLGLVDPLSAGVDLETDDEFHVEHDEQFDLRSAPLDAPAATRNLDLELEPPSQPPVDAGPAGEPLSLIVEIAGLPADLADRLKLLAPKLRIRLK